MYSSELMTWNEPTQSVNRAEDEEPRYTGICMGYNFPHLSPMSPEKLSS